MKNYNLSLNQFFPVPGKTDENKQFILEKINAEAERGADIVCFPEACLTGYMVSHTAGYTADYASVHTGSCSAGYAAGIAVRSDDASVAEICAAAEEKNVVVSFGFLETCGNQFYISHMITGHGETVCYRKTHLGSREKGVFAPGDRLVIYQAGDLKIGVCLCWESHIPDIAAYYRERGIQLLLVPYASGMRGERCREFWRVHLPARASDNGIYAAACNGLITRSGEKGCGLALFDPKGNEIASYYEENEMSVMCRIGGTLPREREEDMKHISYFDHRRPELYRS